MTTWVDWISVIGATASVSAAAWAFKEAQSAKKSATQAQDFRNEIIERRKLVELSKVYLETGRILNLVAKIGPSSDPARLLGVDSAAIAADIDEYTRSLNEQRAHFSEFFDNRAKKLRDDLREDIDVLSEAKDGLTIKAVGKRIYNKLSDFLPVVKELTDEKRERGPAD